MEAFRAVLVDHRMVNLQTASMLEAGKVFKITKELFIFNNSGKDKVDWSVLSKILSLLL